MEWKKLLNSDRLEGKKEDEGQKNDVRNQFEKDVDRILFSNAFRRLGRKTQVHPLAPNDHIHTRLSHSHETSRVGLSLGRTLFRRIKENHPKDLPQDFTENDFGSIVQAACLAHDIGNPPFGHSGESAMENALKSFLYERELELKDIDFFDGNAQGFRVITQIENNLFEGGLRLSYATLGSFVKYPNYYYPGVKKASLFETEKNIFDEVTQKLNLPKIDENSFKRHPLSYLVEAADDICYAILDLEDAVELNLINFVEVKKLLSKLFTNDEYKRINEGLKRNNDDEDYKVENNNFRVNFSRLRGPVFDKLINCAIEGFIYNYNDIMNENFNPDPLFDLMYKEKDDNRNDIRAKVLKKAKDKAEIKVFTDIKKVEIEMGSFSTLDVLISEICASALQRSRILQDEDGKENPKTSLLMQLLGNHNPNENNAPKEGWNYYQCLRRALDFISGMTDNYATYVSKQLKGMAITDPQRP